MAGRARIERGVEARADLFNTGLQLLPLKKCHEGRFIDFVALKTFVKKKNQAHRRMCSVLTLQHVSKQSQINLSRSVSSILILRDPALSCMYG